MVHGNVGRSLMDEWNSIRVRGVYLFVCSGELEIYCKCLPLNLYLTFMSYFCSLGESCPLKRQSAIKYFFTKMCSSCWRQTFSLIAVYEASVNLSSFLQKWARGWGSSASHAWNWKMIQSFFISDTEKNFAERSSPEEISVFCRKK